MSIFPFLPFSPLGLGLFELSPRKAVAADASTCHAPEVLPKNQQLQGGTDPIRFMDVGYSLLLRILGRV